MSKKRNVSYTKPEEPSFLKLMKKQAGYDDKNHKFDKPQNSEKDFVDDDESEQPQVVVVQEGDLSAEQVKREKKNIARKEARARADLSQRVIFQPRVPVSSVTAIKRKADSTVNTDKKKKQLLSFHDEEDDDDDDDDEET